MKGTLYLLHFVPRYHHAGHYLGWCERGGILRRLDQHRSGQGARLTGVVAQAGHELVWVWEGIGTRKDERRLKVHSHLNRICPVCQNTSILQIGRIYERWLRSH